MKKILRETTLTELYVLIEKSFNFNSAVRTHVVQGPSVCDPLPSRSSPAGRRRYYPSLQMETLRRMQAAKATQATSQSWESSSAGIHTRLAMPRGTKYLTSSPHGLPGLGVPF